jgi:hypothetical protein
MLTLSLSVTAGEYLVNDTGETVTGLRVTFSELVTITGFGDTLMIVEPQGEATEFVFSRGELDAWGGHWLNWEPTSAAMLAYEWYTSPLSVEIPEGGLTREDLLNLGRPPTYKEIMAAIAEYPGPDEPLYVPTEDEAIWLTDLEGHADIYDNDSIKINYATWFDKSQITKIEVYRNGIKMRFLPDLSEVLTNEQMKTFDGNPLEHTPASSHTDHAIFGFKYEVICRTISEYVATETILKNPFRYTGDKYAYIGQVWTWEHASMTDGELLAKLRELVTWGFNGIQVDTYAYMASDREITLFLKPEHNPSIGWTRTPTEYELRRILRLAEQVELRTWLRIQVQVSDTFKQSVDRFVWRGSIEPTSVNAWFDSYSGLCVNVARLAEAEGVELLSVGVELSSMQAFASEWVQLVEEVRTQFSGKVSFSEATNHFLEGYHCFNEPLSSFADPAFWNPFDRIEMNYWPNAGCYPSSEQPDQRFQDLTERFVVFWAPAFQYYELGYPSLPIYFGEVGTFYCDSTLVQGWWSNEPGTTDYQEVCDFWASSLIGAEVLGAKAIAVWLYWLHDDSAPSCNLVKLNGSPAAEVVSSFFK